MTPLFGRNASLARFEEQRGPLCSKWPSQPLTNRQEERSTLRVHNTQIHETTQTPPPHMEDVHRFGKFLRIGCRKSYSRRDAWAQQTGIKESLMSLNGKVLMDVRELSAKVGHTYIFAKHLICNSLGKFALTCPEHCQQSLYQGSKFFSDMEVLSCYI